MLETGGDLGGGGGYPSIPPPTPPPPVDDPTDPIQPDDPYVPPVEDEDWIVETQEEWTENFNQPEQSMTGILMMGALSSGSGMLMLPLMTMMSNMFQWNSQPGQDPDLPSGDDNMPFEPGNMFDFLNDATENWGEYRQADEEDTPTWWQRLQDLGENLQFGEATR